MAINKLDTVDWSEERMKEVRHSLRQFLKGVGYKDIDVTYVPCSGLSGENLVKRTPGEALSAWYNGPTLLEAIGKGHCSTVFTHLPVSSSSSISFLLPSPPSIFVLFSQSIISHFFLLHSLFTFYLFYLHFTFFLS